MNRRPTFQNGSFTQDAGGGSSDIVTEQWKAWAEIKDRTGSSYNTEGQDVTVYDYSVRVRFDSRFNSNTTMIYEGQVCKPSGMTIESEGFKNYLRFRYIKTDTWVDLS